MYLTHMFKFISVNVRENRRVIKRHRMKTNKTKNTTQKTRKMSNTDPIK
jgi:hypothetical protein